MSRRTTGVFFIGIAAFLYGIRYLSAAVYGSGSMGWNETMFQNLLDYVGRAPLVLSVLSLIVGVIYLMAAEFGESLKAGMQKAKDNWNAVEPGFEKNQEADADSSK
ncbi:hypothetical protein [Paenibacillus sp. sgz500958]|uniref:hypothetical protein n=1 Tax=Paenibacillus sp. sgz500958 TaxID=3242475 RepID=UPI0036D2FD19